VIGFAECVTENDRWGFRNLCMPVASCCCSCNNASHRGENKRIIAEIQCWQWGQRSTFRANQRFMLPGKSN